VTQLFLCQHKEENSRSPNDEPFTVIGYRDYVTTQIARKADENLRRFRDLLLGFKDGDEFAASYLTSLLDVVFEKIIGNVDLITCIPGHQATTGVRTDPLADLVERIAPYKDCQNGNSILQRKFTVSQAHTDPRPRDFGRQFDSIVASEVPDSKSIRRVLIIDDVYSSGKTMAACYSHLRQQLPEADFIGFAFGRTSDPPMIRWPKTPEFPCLQHLQAQLDDWEAELREEAEANRNFRPEQSLVMGRWKMKIHKITCRYLPNQYWFLDSYDDGIDQGGKPCGVCRPR